METDEGMKEINKSCVGGNVRVKGIKERQAVWKREHISEGNK